MSKKERASSARRIRWCFRASADPDPTLDEDFRNREAEEIIGSMIDHVDKFAFQFECAESGYLHHQGYFELVNKKAKTWILKNISMFEYLAPAKGTPKQVRLTKYEVRGTKQ
jgi:hypothetical protein